MFTETFRLLQLDSPSKLSGMLSNGSAVSGLCDDALPSLEYPTFAIETRELVLMIQVCVLRFDSYACAMLIYNRPESSPVIIKIVVIFGLAITL